MTGYMHWDSGPASALSSTIRWVSRWEMLSFQRHESLRILNGSTSYRFGTSFLTTSQVVLDSIPQPVASSGISPWATCSLDFGGPHMPTWNQRAGLQIPKPLGSVDLSRVTSRFRKKLRVPDCAQWSFPWHVSCSLEAWGGTCTSTSLPTIPSCHLPSSHWPDYVSPDCIVSWFSHTFIGYRQTR